MTKQSTLLDEMKLYMTEIDQLETGGAVKKFRRNKFSKSWNSSGMIDVNLYCGMAILISLDYLSILIILLI